MSILDIEGECGLQKDGSWIMNDEPDLGKVFASIEAANEKQKKQFTFETVAKHLITQGRKAVQTYTGPHGLGLQKSSYCAYRGADGCKCAVGCLIADDQYHPGLERIAAQQQKILNTIPDVYSKDGEFLRELQYVHDRYRAEAWPYRLEELAYKYELDCPQWLVSEYPRGTFYEGMLFIEQAQTKLKENGATLTERMIAIKEKMIANHKKKNSDGN